MLQKQQALSNYARRTALFSTAEEKIELKADTEKGATSFLGGFLSRKPSESEGAVDSVLEDTTGSSTFRDV